MLSFTGHLHLHWPCSVPPAAAAAAALYLWSGVYEQRTRMKMEDTMLLPLLLLPLCVCLSLCVVSRCAAHRPLWLLRAGLTVDSTDSRVNSACRAKAPLKGEGFPASLWRQSRSANRHGRWAVAPATGVEKRGSGRWSEGVCGRGLSVSLTWGRGSSFL